jgi:hypothetical protein
VRYKIRIGYSIVVWYGSSGSGLFGWILWSGASRGLDQGEVGPSRVQDLD